MKENPPSDELNEDLRRSLAATFRLVEEGLDDLLEKRGREGILYRIQDDLPEDSRRRIHVLTERALAIVDDLTQRYRLPHTVTRVSDLLRARAPMLWVMTEETRRRDLSGYGPIGTHALEDLATRLQELGMLLLLMQEVGEEVRGHGTQAPTHRVGP